MDEVFVFTGTLDCFTRKQAQNLVVALGGQFQQNVTKESTCLVAGKQLLILFSSEESVKRKQAEKKHLKILSEEEFLTMCIDQLVKYRNLKTESGEKMTNETFIKQVEKALKNSNLADEERKELEKMLKKLLKNNTPEEVSGLLLEMITPSKKR